MPNSIACICGYQGPSVTEGWKEVCPICRTPAGGALARRVTQTSTAPEPEPEAEPELPPVGDAEKPKSRSYFRIPCPRGHVLKAPASMLGQQAFCPQCNEVFVLNEADSLEHKRRQQVIDREREAQQAKVWLQRAIMAAVFVALSFAVMVALQFMKK